MPPAPGLFVFFTFFELGRGRRASERTSVVGVFVFVDRSIDRSREGRREKINRVADASAGDGTATTAVAAATRARDGERATRTRRGRVRIAVARRRGRRDGAARRRSRPAPGIRVHGERLFSFAASSSDAHLRRREHAAAAEHVTEGTLARAVSTTAGNARNARDRAAGAPRGGGRHCEESERRERVSGRVVGVRCGAEVRSQA